MTRPGVAAKVALICCLALPLTSYPCESPASICLSKRPGSFSLIRKGQPAPVVVDESANPAVRHVAESFAADLERVSGKRTHLLFDARQASVEVVIIGVLGQSGVIDELVRSGKLSIGDISGQWEAFRQVVVDRPFPNVPRALVIVGSDRRGAVFGTYDFSNKIGVSPWYWFADVPVQKRTDIFVTSGSNQDAPKVRYRGFFINDEAPAFSSWAQTHFGGANSKMYAHVFELLLRLKGNYLWPAMWSPRAFNDDDPRNMVLANEMGVVMGTSHHEPMTRAHDEWHRNVASGITGGAWNYEKNSEKLRQFWRGGIQRMMSKGNGESYENVVTIGMRGDGDEAMAEGTAIGLLETIVSDQRHLIEEVTRRPAAETPQVWALYKEVQDYYDHGMSVPDDVTLLFADDNWGQIRRLPTDHLDRKGGYGVYYHFDYVGVPRNYKWLNTVQIEKTWQQMDLAYARNAKALWIVNVGDIKPMEFPLSFFMDHAWNPEAMTLEALSKYSQQWASRTFGTSHGAKIASLIDRYSMYAARRKPELIDAGSFRIGSVAGEKIDGGEFGELVEQWRELEADMLRVKSTLPKHQHAAYLQLVEHPISALSNLYQLYYSVALNRRLAAANDLRANVFADQAEMLFRRDRHLTDNYHHVNEGKWEGMMSQVHFGYTNWQQPDAEVMQEIKRVKASGTSGSIVFKSEKPSGSSGVIAIEAPQFSRAVNNKGLTWQIIPNLGRTLGSVTTLPQGLEATTEQDAVRLEYDIDVPQAGDLTVQLYLSPTLDTTGRGSQHIGISIDEGSMQPLVIKLLPAPNATTLQEQRDWNEAVNNNAAVIQTTFVSISRGKHTLKIWRLDDNVVLQKVIASTGPIPLSYLGPSNKPNGIR